MRPRHILTVVLLAAGGLARAADLNVVTAVGVKDEGAAIVLTIQGSKAPNFTTFSMADPPRFVIDLSESKFQNVPEDIVPTDGLVKLVKNLSYGSDATSIARVMLAFNADIDPPEVSTTGTTLVVRIARPGGAAVPVADAKAAKEKEAAERKAAEAARAEAEKQAAQAKADAEKQAAQAKADSEQREKEQAAHAEADRKAGDDAARAEAELRKAREAYEQERQAAVQKAQAEAASQKTEAEASAKADAARAKEEKTAQARADAEAKAQAKAEVEPEAKAEPVPPPPPAPEAAPAAEPEPAVAAAAPAARGSSRATLREVGFRQLPTGSRVFVRTSAPPRFTIQDVGENTIRVTLEDTQATRRNDLRFLDTSFFPSAIAMVTPKRVGSSYVLDVRMRERVPYQQKIEGDMLAIDFEKPSSSPAAAAPAGAAGGADGQLAIPASAEAAPAPVQ